MLPACGVGSACLPPPPWLQQGADTHAARLQRPPPAPQAHWLVTAPCWPQVDTDTSADARTKWAALWAAVGRSDTALIFRMSHRSRDHYTLVHAARRFYVELGMPCDVPLHLHQLLACPDRSGRFRGAS